MKRTKTYTGILIWSTPLFFSIILQGFTPQTSTGMKAKEPAHDEQLGDKVKVDSNVVLTVKNGTIIHVKTSALSIKDESWKKLIGSRYVIGDIHATDVTPQLWRKLDVRLTKKDGSLAEIQMIRPLWWLKATKAREGGYLDLSVPEAGFRGLARVLRIQRSQADSRNLKAGQHLIISKIKHYVSEYLQLSISGLANPIGITSNHLVFSKARDEWIPAGRLKTGEQLKTVNGVFARVTNIIKRFEPEFVFNIEVHKAKSYYVSPIRVLVHNSGPCSRAPIIVDNDFLINAVKGSSTALDEIRSGVTFVTPTQHAEFMNVIRSTQRAKRYDLIKNEGIILIDPQAMSVFSQTPEFKAVFDAAVKAGHSTADASLAGMASATGYTAVTSERRLSNFFIHTWKSPNPSITVNMKRVR